MEKFLDGIFNWMAENPLLVIIIIAVLIIIFIYNNLNSKKHRVEKSFRKIDVYLEKRFDEIGALLDQTLTAYEHEETTYSAISRLRSGITKAQENGSINDKINAANQVQAFLTNPLIKTENYPALKAITELGMFTARKTSKNEDQLAAARIQYNNNATSYNIKIKSFPIMIFAALFGFSTPFELFKTSDEKRERPISPREEVRKANSNSEIEKIKRDAANQAEIDNIKHEAELLAAKAELEKQKRLYSQTVGTEPTTNNIENNNVNNENNSTNNN